MLGSELTWKLLADALVPPEDSAGAALLVRVLPRTEVMWLGLRGAKAPRHGSKVLLLRGSFAEWQDWPELAEGWAGAKGASRTRSRENAPRGALVTLHAFADGLLLAAGGGASAPAAVPNPARETLQAPERGMFSAAARPERLREVILGRYPRLAEHLGGARRFTGYVDRRAAALELAVDLEFARGEDASAAREILTILLARLARDPCVPGRVAQAAHLSIFEGSLRLEAQLPAHLVDLVEACVLGGTCCA